MRASASDPTLSLIERSAETTEAVLTCSAIGLDTQSGARGPSPAGASRYCAHQRKGTNVCRLRVC